MRRWNHKEGDPAVGHPELADDGALLLEENERFTLEDGVQISFQSALADTQQNYQGHFYRSGDYWLIPARTATGNVEWPPTASGPQAIAPHGVEHHYAPLAVITVAGGGSITKNKDCRYQFKLERTRVGNQPVGGGTSNVESPRSDPLNLLIGSQIKLDWRDRHIVVRHRPQIRPLL